MKRIKGTTIHRNNTKRISQIQKRTFNRRQKLETTTRTTHLLPAIGISIKGLPNDVLVKLLKDMQIPVEQESAMSE
jgi:hypothetical protein